MLHAIFYAEFDNTLGPVVLFDAPKGSVADSVGGNCLFDAISDYSITGPQLSGHLITVSVPKRAFNVTTLPDPNTNNNSSNNKNNHHHHHHHHQKDHSSTCTSKSTPPIGIGEREEREEDENNASNGVYAEMQVVNFPLAIGSHEAGRHYHRNALLFNVGFILSSKKVPAQLFSASLRRLALTLRAMEIESAFLSNPLTKVALEPLLEQILHDFNTFGESTITLDSTNVLSLKLPSFYPITKSASSFSISANYPKFLEHSTSSSHQTNNGSSNASSRDSSRERTGSEGVGGPQNEKDQDINNKRHISDIAATYKEQRILPEVLVHHVPALLIQCSQLLEIDWDLSIHRILPFIDGVKCVKVIAMEADIDVGICQDSIAVLLWHECCCLLDMFQYSNIYALRPGVKRLFGSLCYNADSPKPIITEWSVDTVEFITQLGISREAKHELAADTDDDEDDGDEIKMSPPPPPPAPSFWPQQQESKNMSKQTSLASIPYGDVLACACELAVNSFTLKQSSSFHGHAHQQSQVNHPSSSSLSFNGNSVPPQHHRSPLRSLKKTTGHFNEMHSSINAQQAESAVPPIGQEVLSFFTAFASGYSVREVVCSSKLVFEAFEHRQLVAYGLLNGILQRIHVFPICELPLAALDAVIDDAAMFEHTQNNLNENQDSGDNEEEEEEEEVDSEEEEEVDSEESSVGDQDSGTEAAVSPTSTEPVGSNNQTNKKKTPKKQLKKLVAPKRKRQVRSVSRDVMRAALVLMNGEHSLDEIGCQLFLAEAQIRNIVDLVNSVAPTNQDAICFIYK